MGPPLYMRSVVERNEHM